MYLDIIAFSTSDLHDGATDKFEIGSAKPQYLFDDIQFIRSMVKQSVEGISLCK